MARLDRNIDFGRYALNKFAGKIIELVGEILRYVAIKLSFKHSRELAIRNVERQRINASWFISDEVSLVRSLASLIVPPDDVSPGASDVAETIDTIERSVVASPQLRVMYARGLYSFNQWALWKYGVPFIKLAYVQQLALMKMIDYESQNLGRPASLPSKVMRQFKVLRYLQRGLFPALEFFPTLVNDVLRTFYTCGVCWAWLGYDGPPMPEGYPNVAELRSSVKESQTVIIDSSPQHLDAKLQILVCMKQVPSTYSRYIIDESGCSINEDDLIYETNETDLYALEEALRLKRNIGARVSVLSVGEKRVLKTLREALAKGADRAIHVIDIGLQNTEAIATATIIASAINDENYDLVLAGVESGDLAFGQTGILLAQLLGWPCVTIVADFNISEDLTSLVVKRELGNDTFERVEIRLPAVLTIQTSTKDLIPASLKGILQARKKEIQALSPMEAGLKSGGSSSIACGELHLPVREKNTVILEGSPGVVSKALIEKLRQDAKVL